MISAAEQHVLGCPLPAAVVDDTESMRRRVAIFISAGTRGRVCTGKDEPPALIKLPTHSTSNSQPAGEPNSQTRATVARRHSCGESSLRVGSWRSSSGWELGVEFGNL